MTSLEKKLLQYGNKPVSDKELRIFLLGAAESLEQYSVSEAFDFVGHIDILRPIVQGIERLMVITDAHKARKQ